MKPDAITPIQDFGGWWAKRDDLALYSGPDRPCGSKLRQFMKMAAKSPLGTPLVVGCSRHASMQIYLTEAANRLGVRAYVFVPKAVRRTNLTDWSEAHGAEIHYVTPGFPSSQRKAARTFAAALGGCVRWCRTTAIEDVAIQAAEPMQSGVKRVWVVTGSGLTAAGVALGLMRQGRLDIEVAMLDICQKTDVAGVAALIDFKKPGQAQPRLTLVNSAYKYGKLAAGCLPDGTPLDSNYAAKALPLIQPGDMLWVQGCRPLSLNKPIK